MTKRASRRRDSKIVSNSPLLLVTHSSYSKGAAYCQIIDSIFGTHLKLFEITCLIVLDKLFEEALLANLTSWIDTRIALEAGGLIADWTLKSLQPGAQWSYLDQLAQQIQNMRWQLGIWRRRWLWR